MPGSFSTITIQRAAQVVNGHIQLPPNKAKNRTATTIAQALVIAGTTLVRLGDTGGASDAGGRHGVQEFIKTPPVAINAVDTVFNQLRALQT